MKGDNEYRDMFGFKHKEYNLLKPFLIIVALLILLAKML